MTTMLLELEPMFLERPEPVDVPGDCARLLDSADEIKKLGGSVELPVAARIMRSRLQGNQLAENLHELAIGVFDYKELNEYKNSLRTAARKRHGRHFLKPISLISILGALALVVWPFFADISDVLAERLYVIAVSMGTIGIILASVGIALTNLSWDREWYWTSGRRIPIAVREMATRFHERLPDVDIWIEYLGRTGEGLLIVSYGDREYYVAAWDNKGYLRPR